MSRTLHVVHLSNDFWGVKYGGSMTWIVDGLMRQQAIDIAKAISDGEMEIVSHKKVGLSTEIISKSQHLTGL